MIEENPDIPAALVGAAVETGWGVHVTAVEHVDGGPDAWHWVVGDDVGPQWSASLHRVSSTSERRSLEASFEAGALLARRLTFVVAPVRTRDGRVAVGLAPGLLLSLAPYLEVTPGRTERVEDDAERSVLANMMGDLHRQSRPAELPVWRPALGRGVTAREELVRCLEQDTWSGGPWSGPTGQLLTDARPVLRAALRRFELLGAAVSGTVERWVVTHGNTTAGLVRTPDGHRLVGWDRAARAPRERDLGEALGGAEGEEPWWAYLEAGGPPEPLSPDSVELFALERTLSAIAEHAPRLVRPHEDTADERRRFELLEEQLSGLLASWA